MGPRPEIGDSWGGYRARLVETIQQRGIRNLSVLAAVAGTPRHLFVPEALRERAYDDTSLPIGNGQTISQPSTHARYLEALDLCGTEKVLEIGTGSGYQTALLAFLADVVVSVERIPALAETARRRLDEAGYRNVSVVTGDGTLGWRPLAPYDAILVGAAGSRVPAPLLDQLADGGRLVIPVHEGDRQVLRHVRKHGGSFDTADLGPVNFVPLRGRHGVEPDSA